MNIKQAKEIPLEVVLQAIGAVESKAKPDRSAVWFKSPLREGDNEASFKIEPGRGTWYDFGSGQGGDVIKLAQAHLGGKTVSEALQWLKQFGGASVSASTERPPQARKSAPKEASNQGEAVFKLVKEKNITHKGLMAYIQSRGLSAALVNLYCREVTFKGPKSERSLWGIGFANDKGGFEVRGAAENFKTVIGQKAPTTLYSRQQVAKCVHVFEGFFDFLSFVRMTEPDESRAAIVLNSTTQAASVAGKIQADPRLQNAESVALWLDNDTTGERTLHEMSLELVQAGFRVQDMSVNYEGHKDLNAYLQWVQQSGQWPSWAVRTQKALQYEAPQYEPHIPLGYISRI